MTIKFLKTHTLCFPVHVEFGELFQTWLILQQIMSRYYPRCDHTLSSIFELKAIQIFYNWFSFVLRKIS